MFGVLKLTAKKMGIQFQLVLHGVMQKAGKGKGDRCPVWGVGVLWMMLGAFEVDEVGMVSDDLDLCGRT